jgi:hypothetical protein
VPRSALARYHDKLLIIDRRLLFVLSFNFTHLDIDHSRGFGVVTKKGKLVQEALNYSKRTTIEHPTRPALTPSWSSRSTPASNSSRSSTRPRKSCSSTIPRLPTRRCCALRERAKQGVDVRVIGTIGRHSARRARGGLEEGKHRLEQGGRERDRREGREGGRPERVQEMLNESAEQ